MSVERLKLGKEGEKSALKYLKRHRYKIIEKNYRCRWGEIDIIAKDHGVLAFIEVKTRSLGAALEAVDRRKQNQITKAALSYLAENKLQGRECRFDVVGIDNSLHPPQITLVKDAFEAENIGGI